MKRFALTAMMGWLAVGPVFAECVEPPAFADLPNGATASGDTMVAALKALRAYDATVKQYAECMKKTGRSAEKPDAAVERLQLLADKFNAELRVFKAKTSS